MTIERKTLPEQHYLYVQRQASFEGNEIANAMASGFGEVFGFVGQKGIRPLAMPMSVYIDMPEGGKMTFRAGVLVSEEDAGKAEGTVEADILPAGDVLTATHVGPYASLNQTHNTLWDHAKEHGLPRAMPVWEIYVDDPGETDEAELRTEIYHAIGT